MAIKRVQLAVLYEYCDISNTLRELWCVHDQYDTIEVEFDSTESVCVIIIGKREETPQEVAAREFKDNENKKAQIKRLQNELNKLLE